VTFKRPYGNKPNKTVGPDNIPAYIVKSCSNIFEGPLYTLFSKNKCLFGLWKESIICPVPKAGIKIKVDNYRLVAILSTVAKVFESVIYDQVILHVKSVLSIYQHGFLLKRSILGIDLK